MVKLGVGTGRMFPSPQSRDRLREVWLCMGKVWAETVFYKSLTIIVCFIMHKGRTNTTWGEFMTVFAKPSIEVTENNVDVVAFDVIGGVII